jgi:hypothetical protein
MNNAGQMPGKCAIGHINGILLLVQAEFRTDNDYILQ